jgi:lipopolysaccharide export system protein LptA
MKYLSRLLFLSLIASLAICPAAAQTADTATTDAVPAGSTVITSDELHSDQTTHISIFTGNVIVTGTNFKMTCQEMTVYFTPTNKVDKIVATGDVVISQPDRVTHCGHAEYFQDDDKFVLTDQPVIHDHNDTQSGNIITIYRTSQKMTVTGGRSTTILGGGSLGSSKPAPSPIPTEDK